MTIITISWQIGTDGARVGALVGERLGIPVVDHDVVEAVMRALDTTRAEAVHLEQAVPSWRVMVSMSLLATAGVPALRADLIRARAAQAVAAELVREAARSSCVVMGRCGFALLADHPGACHVRLAAPLEWRIARVAARECIPAQSARRIVLADDRMRADFARHNHGRRIDDPRNFHLVLAAERFGCDRLVDVIAAAAHRRAAAEPAPRAVHAAAAR
jgi:Cytidylate kinase-like family